MMFRRPFAKCALVLGMMILLGGLCQAAITVTSPRVIAGQASHGTWLDVPLEITSAQSLAGVNGELVFERKFFSNPQLMADASNKNIIALGNEIHNDPAAADYDPTYGHYRFVVYTDPTNALNLSWALLGIRFQVVNRIEVSTISTMRFVLPGATGAGINLAASDLNGGSLDGALSDIQFRLESTSVKGDWTVYE